MKALATDGKGHVEVVEVKKPEPGPYQALVKIHSCIFCNSTDMHIIEGRIPPGGTFPAVFGHESFGTVVEVGDKVRNFKVDDRVLRAMWPGDDTYESYWGGFAQYGLIGDNQAAAEDGTEVELGHSGQKTVEAPIADDDAALMIVYREAAFCVDLLQVEPGSRWGVLGVGAAGLCFAQLLQMAGAEEVISVGRRQKPLEVAMKLGAQKTVNTREADLVAELGKLDGLIDAAGSSKLLYSAAGCLKPGGKLGLYAVQLPGLELDKLPTNIFMVKLNPTVGEGLAHDDIQEHFIRGTLTADPLLTHHLPLSRAEEAVELIRNKEAIKLSIRMHDE